MLRLFRIHSYVTRWCCSPGYFALCPLGKFCQELKLVYLDLKLENSRTLGSARPVDWKSPRTLESSAISCPTHLVTCLHRVLVVTETLQRRTRVDWWCTCYFLDD